MKTILIIFFNAALVSAQTLPVLSGLTGDPGIDLTLRPPSVDSLVSPGPGSPKSPLRAAAYSAAIPGLGEFYAEEYWRSAVFLGAEIALWTLYAVYDGKGDAQTREFEAYADQFWSVVRYAEWMEMHGGSLNPNPPPTGIVTSNDPNLPPWQRVNWELLNQWEQHIGGRASTGFSHRLPRRPEQQYYELIGKYLQYNMGWDDWDPGRTDYLISLSQRFAHYRDMRGRANDLYTIARTSGYLIVLNHLLSAVDAALSASSYNRSLKLEARLKPTPRSYGFVEFVPTATLSVSF